MTFDTCIYRVCNCGSFAFQAQKFPLTYGCYGAQLMRSVRKCSLSVEHRKWETGVKPALQPALLDTRSDSKARCERLLWIRAELGLGASCLPLPTWEVKLKLNLGKLLPLYLTFRCWLKQSFQVLINGTWEWILNVGAVFLCPYWKGATQCPLSCSVLFPWWTFSFHFDTFSNETP